MAVRKPKVLTKTDFVKRYAEEHAVTVKNSKETVDAFLATLNSILAEGNGVRFTGLGTLVVTKRAAREGINPGTGKKMKIPAHNAVTFKMGKTLKEAVNVKKSKAKKK